MQFNIISVGNKMPEWVVLAFQVYQNRFFKPHYLSLVEIPPKKRGKNCDIQGLKEQEGEAILKAIPPKSFTIALDVQGHLIDTPSLAKHISHWEQNTPIVNFVIGGPDGLSKPCLAKANYHWSLSPLTLPHPLVRIVVAEQLYRALSILNNHPYHRE